MTTVQVGSQVSGTIKALHADLQLRGEEGAGGCRARSIPVPDAGRPGTLDADRSCRLTATAREGRGSTMRRDEAASGAGAVRPEADLAQRPRDRAVDRRAGRGGDQVARRRMVTQARAVAESEPGQPGAHHHHARRSTASSSRAAWTSGQTVAASMASADAVRHRAGPGAHAGEREHRRIGHRPHRGRAGR